MTQEILITGLVITGLSFLQNVSFALVGRSRNRDNFKYHIIASCFSNTIWFVTFKELIALDMNIIILPFYMVGTVLGSVAGVKISMTIETWLGASTDSHLKKE
jgi:hypothetical protein